FDSSIFLTADALALRLEGSDRKAVRIAAEELKLGIAKLPGAYSIRDSMRTGKREIRIKLRRGSEALGLAHSDLANQIRQGFHGVAVKRIQRGREDIPVVIRYPADERASLSDLESIRIRTPRGIEVPFSAVATARIERGVERLYRAEGRSVVTVSADINREIASAEVLTAEVVETLLPEILANHPEIEFSLVGERRERDEFLAVFLIGYAIALIAVYAMLAIPLRSYTQPLLILLAIPFGAVGAVAGHMVLGMSVTAFALLGVLALSGVVINDTLVLLYGIQQYRDKGMSLDESLVTAAQTRFRPIVLTTVTTFFGLTPLMLEQSVQAQWLKPVAISLAFGEIVSTPVVLLLVPACYRIAQDVSVWFNARSRGRDARGVPASEDVNPLGFRATNSGSEARRSN
ncbi:MAG: efflux RND transporter permease subunit, partial [Myxococcota bacterium]